MKTILTATTLWLALALPSAADKLSVNELSQYLNSFVTAEAEFTQINDDNSISTGTLSLRRPGRARFDYAPPNKGLVIAGGGQVAIFDEASNTPPEQFPLRRTPLNIILARTVNLAASDMLLRHDYDGTATSIVLQDPENPEYGNIRLVFTDAPVTLRQWIITNDAGSETTVILGDMRTGVDLGTARFNIVQEIERRGLR